MSPPRSSASLLLGLAALAAVADAHADGAPPAPPAAGNDGGPARPQPPTKPAGPAPSAHPKEAMTLHDEAWALYEEGRYRAAIERLEAALRIDPDGAELVYNLALLHEKLGDLRDAIAQYRRYLEMEADPKAKARALSTLRRLEGAEREAALRPPAPLAPAPPPPLPPSRRLRPGVVAAGSISGAALVIGTAFGIRALVTNPGSSGRTGPDLSVTDLQADAHAAHTDAVVADTSFAVGAVAAGAALILYLAAPRALAALTPSSSGGSPRATLDLRPGAPGLVRVLF
jgi:tetratricopeptide (TPR) repeat protein